MGILSKGASVAFASTSSKHSRNASSSARKSASLASRARSERDMDKKMSYLAESIEHLSKAVMEMSDSVPPIGKMIALNEVFSENLAKMIKEKM